MSLICRALTSQLLSNLFQNVSKFSLCMLSHDHTHLLEVLVNKIAHPLLLSKSKWLSKI